MKSLSGYTVGARFKRNVSASWESASLTYGSEFKFNVKHLEKFTFENAKEQDVDVLLLVAVVNYLDRLVGRRLSVGWRREFEVRMPVSNPIHWQKKNISAILSKVLNMITGDSWRFQFCKRSQHISELRYLPLDKQYDFQIVPFSDGLDSLALVKSLGISNNYLRITAWGNDLSRKNMHRCNDGKKRIPIPVSASTGNHSELSFRTRPFKFLMLGALAAKFTASKTIIVPENGQGVFSPVFTSKGIETTYWGSHPFLTQDLKELVVGMIDYDIEYSHPNIWKTKGEILSETKIEEREWRNTISCSLGVRNKMLFKGKRINCGMCSNCMLRRLSLFTSGHGINPEHYFWSDLSAKTFDGTESINKVRKNSRHDCGMAFHAILSIDNFARLLEKTASVRSIKRHAFELGKSNIFPENLAESNIVRLIEKHRQEWHAFLNEIPKESWIHKVVKANV